MEPTDRAKGASESAIADADAQELRSLGYEQELKREFGFRDAIMVGFALISPIVATYGVFGLALGMSGPTMVWGLFAVLTGQMLVALVFAETAGRFPLAGGVYQWTRQLVGNRAAWFGGWAYMWTMVITMAATAYASATFVVAAVGWSPSGTTMVFLSFGWIAFFTFANTVGRWVLKVFMSLSVAAEFIASIVLGLILIIGYKVNPFSVLWDAFGTNTGSDWNWFTFAWLGAVAFIGWSFVGFESPGAIAEEVHRPERSVPRAIWMSLMFVGVVVIFTNFAWILAIPDIKAAMTGNIADPMLQTLEYHLGTGITTPVLILISLGFTASGMACQTSGSRTLFSFARDRMIPGHEFFRALTVKNKLPARAIALTGVLAVVLLSINFVTERVYATLTLFGTAGFYIAFLFPVAAALYLHVMRRHQPAEGAFSLRKFSFPVTLIAAGWLLFEIINICWPRSPGTPWYSNYGTAFMVGIVAALGLLAYLTAPSRGVPFESVVTKTTERGAAVTEARED